MRLIYFSARFTCFIPHVSCFLNQAELSVFIWERLFPFPTNKRNPERRERWKQLIGRKSGDQLWYPLKDSRMCSQHFVNSEPSLDNPLPTMNLGYDGYESFSFGLEKPVSGYKEVKNNDDILVACPIYPEPPMDILQPSIYQISVPVMLMLMIVYLIEHLKQANLKLQSTLQEKNNCGMNSSIYRQRNM